MPAVSASVDASSILKAIELARRSTSRRLEKLLGDTAYRVAWKAGKYTPYVELSTIDSELDEVIQNTNKHPKFNSAGHMRVGVLPWTR